MANIVLGYIGALVAVLCFGTFAVPIKIVPTGDGIMFQWIECCAIMIVGIVVECIAGRPFTFEPLGMLGGMLWCVGNITVIPIVDNIGLGLGLLIWGLFNMVTGWACGHFGIVVDKEAIKYPVLNYLGLTLACLSILLYFPIKSVSKKAGEEDGNDTTSINAESQPLIAADAGSSSSELSEKASARKKIVGVSLSVVAGLLYGTNMLPISYLQQKHPHANPMAFALSHFSGIFITSTLIAVVYSLYKRNKPQVYPQSILPALFAGVLWAIAQSGWFVGNANLGLTVAFPIICTGPGIVGSLWGVFAFKEIQGARNLALLFSAFFCTLGGILLITFSHGV
jgi:glucose uptake protein GlcU